MAQEINSKEIPFKAIPEAAPDYEAGNLIVRMIEGAGYRYYWATEGLTDDDLSFKPSDSGKSTFETLEHIHELSEIIKNTALNKVIIRPSDPPPIDWLKIRSETLYNLEDAASAFKEKSPEELNGFNLMFETGGKQSVFPLWNLINGPISDFIYHSGQIVSFRRSGGNPIPKGVNVFIGKTRE
tara:strand:+ start:4908 stop:5456 length:549 start_codon:yes stop_codon:yes gene_type:complete